MKLYFDTDPAWIEALQAWGASDPRVAAIWIFGSRARGVRTLKDSPPPFPDLDVGFTLTLTDDDADEFAYEELGWVRERLQAVIPVKLDLQLADTATDARVWPAIIDHGVLIYERRG